MFPSNHTFYLIDAAKDQKKFLVVPVFDGSEIQTAISVSSVIGTEKVLDDPKLLQKSIKREARAKKKSREKWEERTAKVKEQMDAAQTKRKSNIKARKDGKMERKMDKASNKRNRPGFEGRSDGFINK